MEFLHEIQGRGNELRNSQIRLPLITSFHQLIPLNSRETNESFQMQISFNAKTDVDNYSLMTSYDTSDPARCL